MGLNADAVTAALCRAVDERRVVAFVYKGSERRAEPHIMGVDRADVLTLEAW